MSEEATTLDKTEADDLQTLERVARINKAFQEGKTALDVLEDLRALPCPILLDFNNVLANNSIPLQMNPDAPAFMDELVKMGTVCIVTTAKDWEAVSKFLVDSKLWNERLVLMTSSTWRPMTEDDYRDSTKLNPIAEKIKNDFLAFREREGSPIDPTMKFTAAAPAEKRIAPIFKKQYDIPLIDDYSMATENNPGIHGIRVAPWDKKRPIDWDHDEYGTSNVEYRPPTLPEVLTIVRDYLESVKKL